MTCEESSPRDYRGRVIEHLADQEHALARDLGALRELLHLALGRLHQMGKQLDRLREQHHRLHDEYRSLREQVLRDERSVA